ncbi:15973_t:CDS:2, partial [Acaulospora morrowiae]
VIKAVRISAQIALVEKKKEAWGPVIKFEQEVKVLKTHRNVHSNPYTNNSSFVK